MIDPRFVQEQNARHRRHLISRITFSCLFIMMLLIVTVLKNEKFQYLAEGECLRDYMFVWTEHVNTFFVESTPWKNFLII